MAVNYNDYYNDAAARQNSIAAQKAAALLKKTRYSTNKAPATGKVQDPYKAYADNAYNQYLKYSGQQPVKNSGAGYLPGFQQTNKQQTSQTNQSAINRQNKLAKLETKFDTIQPGSKPTTRDEYLNKTTPPVPNDPNNGNGNGSGNGNYGGGGSSVSPAGVTNNYGGMSDEDFRANLVAAVKGGIISEYEANAAVIKNNLANALSSLDAELAALDPLYQNQLKTIASNQFTNQEATKEMMNQSGWTGANSGLAIGEQTKIGVAADNNRANALQQKTLSEADINRRKTLEQQNFGTNLASLEAQKNAKLSSAEANALIESEARRRSMFESDREYQMEIARFQESQSQFRQQLSLDKQKLSAAQKAQQAQTDAAAKAQANAELEERLYNDLMSDLYEAKTAEEATNILRSMGTDTSIPSSIKNQIYDFYDKYVGGMKEYYTEG